MIYPCPIKVIKNIFIPLSDGTRLSARIWLPEGAEDHPVPAILEYIPYRKNDGTATLDALNHPYFASHGYVSIRVDMRGSGDSDGILMDEYLKIEQDDALEVLSWIAKQPYCTGAVGMIGYSWGGYTGLQVAARRPPELKAVVTVYSTDNRYETDVHYIGGCLFASDMVWWASIFQAFQARPPDPENVGERWREMWLNRLEKTPAFIEEWVRHQYLDNYWKHGSVCEDYSSITCPVFVVGGWADCYPGVALRLLDKLQVPRKGLIGPWGHAYPHIAAPGPRIGFLQECLRWWDFHLKGIDTGIMDEPILRAWMQESIPPSSHYFERPGRWVADAAWPSPFIHMEKYYLCGSVLGEKPTAEEQLDIQGSLASGMDAGIFCPDPSIDNVSGGQFPPDQRMEDGLAQSFTSSPLQDPIEILGHAKITLLLAVDRPRSLIAVRLCDVDPHGASTLVARGILNLTHRESHQQPTPLHPGSRYTVQVELKATAYSFPVGHRLRVSISPTYWPWAWPSPETAILTLFTGPECYLELPIRVPRPEDAQLKPFEPPVTAAPLSIEILQSETRKREKRQEIDTGLIELTRIDDFGKIRIIDSGIEFGLTQVDIQRIIEGKPLSASIQAKRSISLGRGGWQTRVEIESLMTSDQNSFLVSNHLDAYEGNTRVFSKSWDCKIPRMLN